MKEQCLHMICSTTVVCSRMCLRYRILAFSFCFERCVNRPRKVNCDSYLLCCSKEHQKNTNKKLVHILSFFCRKQTEKMCILTEHTVVFCMNVLHRFLFFISFRVFVMPIVQHWNENKSKNGRR